MILIVCLPVYLSSCEYLSVFSVSQIGCLVSLYAGLLYNCLCLPVCLCHSCKVSQTDYLPTSLLFCLCMSFCCFYTPNRLSACLSVWLSTCLSTWCFYCSPCDCQSVFLTDCVCCSVFSVTQTGCLSICLSGVNIHFSVFLVYLTDCLFACQPLWSFVC